MSTKKNRDAIVGEIQERHPYSSWDEIDQSLSKAAQELPKTDTAWVTARARVDLDVSAARSRVARGLGIHEDEL
jgi:hypothetical protein